MKKVAVIEGGYSKEKAISIKSAKTVFDNLDRTKFNPIRVLIDENEWTAYDDKGRYFIDKNDFSFIKNGTKHNLVDAFSLKRKILISLFRNGQSKIARVLNT